MNAFASELPCAFITGFVTPINDYPDNDNEFNELYRSLKVPTMVNDINELDFVSRMIIRKIESQRTNLNVFVEDDGVRQLRDLANLLEKNEYNEFMLDSDLFNILETGDRESISKVFDKYIAYVEGLKKEFLPHEENIFEDKKEIR